MLDRRQPLEEALDRLPEMDARDRAAGHRLAAAVLRRLGSLDAVLESLLRRQPPEPARHVLRIGAAGLLLLDVPAHAAVATSVALTRARGLSPFAGVVNAVLRRVATTGRAALDDLDGPRLDTPAWLWASWGADARAIAAAHQAPDLLHRGPPLDLSLKPGAAPPEGGEPIPTGSYRLPPGTRVADLAGFTTGDFWVQDAAAALPAALLAVRGGERVADLCAAPGGKTAQLATAGAEVTAIERDPVRIARLAENLRRLRLEASLVPADVEFYQPDQQFDAVLLDAPCSATGTIRRHPDVAYVKRPTDIPALAAAQDRLLASAARMLRPGGRLIYAVCSLQPEEGQAKLASAARLGLAHDPFTAEELVVLPQARSTDGCLRTHPAMWPERGGMDGFFAVRLRRLS